MVNTEWDPTGGAIALGICAMPFVPIVDGKFLLKDNPERILQSGELRKTPVLLGANREEGTYFLIYFLTHLFKLQHNVSSDEGHTRLHYVEISLESLPTFISTSS